MSPSIWDLFSTADFRTIFLALISVGLSLAFAFPAAVSVLRWIVSRVRLQLILRKENLHACNTSDSKIDVSVSGLFVHPVKSMRSISLSESTLDRKGLTGDRRFMVVYELPLPVYKKNWGQGDTTHRFLTQRQCPSLATISATMDDSKSERVLVLEQKSSTSGKHPSTTIIRIPLTNKSHPQLSSNQRHLAGIWDDVVAVEDMGDDAAAFLQAIADADDELSASTQGGSKKVVRLVTESTTSPLPPMGTDDRSYVPGYAKTWTGGFLGKPTLTDGFPILIASEASLEALNEKLVEGGKETIPMSRFRPNIVVKGTLLTPFEEDRWKVVAIGDTVFAIVKACPRCKQSCTDQTTGTVSPEMEPVETMKSFRRSLGNQPSNGDVFFAQNAIPIGKLEGKTIRVGDSVRILETGDPVYK
jgi:uncharacterized protein YcbX